MLNAKRVLLCAMISCSIVSVSAIIEPSVGYAKSKRAKKKSRQKAKKKASKKKAGKKQAKAAPAERKVPVSFDNSARPDDVGMDSRADQRRDESILKLKKLLPTISDGAGKAELIFRLSEMYWGKSKYNHMRAMQIWDEKLDLWAAAGQKGPEPQLKGIPELDKAGLFKREALKLYSRILKEYPSYERQDEVLYNLGSSHYESGHKKKGISMYWKLIKRFPHSDYTADAWLQLGEHFFNANKLSQAVKAYGKAAETKKPRIYSFALYKLAWCDFNLGEYDRAVDKFTQVITYAKESKKAGTSASMKGGIQLIGEALADMVRTYSHLDAIEGPIEFYNKELGPEKSYDYLHRLASLYGDEGKWPLQINMFRHLNERYPYHAKAPNNQTSIMNAFSELGKRDMVRKEVRRLVSLYAPGGIWARKNAGKEILLANAFESVETELAGLVTEQHRAAQETKLSATYKLARDIYKEYLDKFTKSINSYKFGFFYAEILYELKEFNKAAVAYDSVVLADAKGEFIKVAAYNSILSWEKVISGVEERVGKKITNVIGKKKSAKLKELEKLRALQKGKDYKESPLTAHEMKLAAACDKFVEVAPKDDGVVKVKFKSARLYYLHNQFEPAAERFGEIIDRWPNDSLARIGAESIIQSFNVRSDWSNLRKWSAQFSADKKLMADKYFAKRILAFLEGASFNEIHFVFESKETPVQIADRYWEFGQKFPESKYVLVGLYNSIVNYDKSNVLERSIATAEHVLKRYKNFKISEEDVKKSKKDGSALPKPELIREKVLFLAASFYERLAEFEISAKLYEQFADEFPKSKKHADAVFNAALFREGLGHYNQAIVNFERYIKENPKKKDVPDIYWRIGLIHEKKKAYKVVEKHFAAFGKHAGHDKARYYCSQFKVVEALEKQGKGEAAAKQYPALVKSFQKLSKEDKIKPCSLKAAATAAFKLLKPELDAYLALKLIGVSERKMVANLTKKLGLISELQGKYTSVLAIGEGGFGVAALYQIGIVYQDLANEMLATQCPRKLDDDQCGMYLAALQEKAFPLEEKAIEAFDKALSKGYELGVYTVWLEKAQEAMKDYEPDRFPDIHTYDLIASESSSAAPTLLEIN